MTPGRPERLEWTETGSPDCPRAMAAAVSKRHRSPHPPDSSCLQILHCVQNDIESVQNDIIK